MADIREEAQAEAERRWPMDAVYTLEPTFTARELHAYEASAFLAGAVWADARKVEVAVEDVEWEYGIFRPASMPDMSGKPTWTQIVSTRFFTLEDAENALRRVPGLRDKAKDAVILKATRRGPWIPVEGEGNDE